VVIDYYDEDDSNLWQKRMVESDIRIIDAIPTAMKIVMINKNDNSQTEMELLEMKYNIPLDDKMFTERELKNEEMDFRLSIYAFYLFSPYRSGWS